MSRCSKHHPNATWELEANSNEEFWGKGTTGSTVSSHKITVLKLIHYMSHFVL